MVVAQSRYLWRLMMRREEDFSVVVLPSVRRATMALVLRFLYTGDLYVQEAQLAEVRHLLEQVLHLDTKINFPERLDNVVNVDDEDEDEDEEDEEEEEEPREKEEEDGGDDDDVGGGGGGGGRGARRGRRVRGGANSGPRGGGRQGSNHRDRKQSKEESSSRRRRASAAKKPEKAATEDGDVPSDPDVKEEEENTQENQSPMEESDLNSTKTEVEEAAEEEEGDVSVNLLTTSLISGPTGETEFSGVEEAGEEEDDDVDLSGRKSSATEEKSNHEEAEFLMEEIHDTVSPDQDKENQEEEGKKRPLSSSDSPLSTEKPPEKRQRTDEEEEKEETEEVEIEVEGVQQEEIGVSPPHPGADEVGALVEEEEEEDAREPRPSLPEPEAEAQGEHSQKQEEAESQEAEKAEEKTQDMEEEPEPEDLTAGDCNSNGFGPRTHQPDSEPEEPLLPPPTEAEFSPSSPLLVPSSSAAAAAEAKETLSPSLKERMSSIKFAKKNGKLDTIIQKMARAAAARRKGGKGRAGQKRKKGGGGEDAAEAAVAAALKRTQTCKPVMSLATIKKGKGKKGGKKKEGVQRSHKKKKKTISVSTPGGGGQQQQQRQTPPQDRLTPVDGRVTPYPFRWTCDDPDAVDDDKLIYKTALVRIRQLSIAEMLRVLSPGDPSRTRYKIMMGKKKAKKERKESGVLTPRQTPTRKKSEASTPTTPASDQTTSPDKVPKKRGRKPGGKNKPKKPLTGKVTAASLLANAAKRKYNRRLPKSADKETRKKKRDMKKAAKDVWLTNQDNKKKEDEKDKDVNRSEGVIIAARKSTPQEFLDASTASSNDESVMTAGDPMMNPQDGNVSGSSQPGFLAPSQPTAAEESQQQQQQQDQHEEDVSLNFSLSEHSEPSFVSEEVVFNNAHSDSVSAPPHIATAGAEGGDSSLPDLVDQAVRECGIAGGGGDFQVQEDAVPTVDAAAAAAAIHPGPSTSHPPAGKVLFRGEWVTQKKYDSAMAKRRAKQSASLSDPGRVRGYNYRPFVTLSGRSKEETITRHEEDLDGHYPCPVCGIVYARANSLQSHMSRQHNPKANMECGVCGKKVASSSAMSKHALTHKPKSEWPYECPLCLRAFQAKGDLPKHLLSNLHTNDTVRKSSPDVLSSLCLQLVLFQVPRPGSAEWLRLMDRAARFPSPESRGRGGGASSASSSRSPASSASSPKRRGRPTKRQREEQNADAIAIKQIQQVQQVQPSTSQGSSPFANSSAGGESSCSEAIRNMPSYFGY